MNQSEILKITNAKLNLKGTKYIAEIIDKTTFDLWIIPLTRIYNELAKQHNVTITSIKRDITTAKNAHLKNISKEHYNLIFSEIEDINSISSYLKCLKIAATQKFNTLTTNKTW